MGEPEPARASRLARARSAYLRSAAEQAIDWHPWGREPFELARRTGRPVLLDIGASWCHWCHVMDEGTYSDPEVARLLAQQFVAVKVDRDEHPEIDRRFQRQVSALTGEGGWPLTAFLTSDGEAFYGGTYFPPTDGHGRPGFRRLLREIGRLWSEEPGRVRANAELVRDALARQGPAAAPPPVELGRFVDGVLRDLDRAFDPAHAGFGGAPKFPHPAAVRLLLWDEARAARAASGEKARDTLVQMADGGLYDQLGGGFHRYSVDEGWHVPHFEKMGVDNAELLGAYVDGLRRFGDPRFEEVVRGIVGWSTEILGDPAGGWGASQDADNAPGDDGSYFTWTRAEIRDVLGPEEARLVTRAFGVGTDARMPHDPDRNVLFRLLTAAEAAEGLPSAGDPGAALARACARLRAARDRRPAPTVDRALYASINGRFVGAYAEAGAAIAEPAWIDRARTAAERWLAHAYAPERGVAHRLDGTTASGYGLLDDQVSFARGLLELAVGRADPAYLRAATSLLELTRREFAGDDGLLRDVAPSLYEGPEIGGATAAAYSLEDAPHLSANAAAALAFVRLGALVNEPTWTEAARGLLGAIARRLDGTGLFAAGSALGAGLLETPPVRVVVEGSGPAADALERVARRAWHPGLSVFRGTPPEPFSLPEEARAARGSSEPRALVCFGSSCAPPITAPAALAEAIRAGRPAPG